MSEQTNATTKIPGPDHPITIERNPKQVVVSIGGAALADSRDALILREAGYPVVQYIPRKDVDMALLLRTAHATYCPYKGDCACFSIPSGGERGLNAVWTYEDPCDALAALGNHLAFYSDGVDAIEERSEDQARAAPPDESQPVVISETSPLVTAPLRLSERLADPEHKTETIVMKDTDNDQAFRKDRARHRRLAWIGSLQRAGAGQNGRTDSGPLQQRRERSRSRRHRDPQGRWTR
jgi:uncharacterized protein (DUF427 family)